jgi:hypothetical protein
MMSYHIRDANGPTISARTCKDSGRDSGGGALVGTVITMAIVMAALAYGLSRPTPDTATGPSSTISPPSTTGQGGGAAATGGAR